MSVYCSIFAGGVQQFVEALCPANRAKMIQFGKSIGFLTVSTGFSTIQLWNTRIQTVKAASGRRTGRRAGEWKFRPTLPRGLALEKTCDKTPEKLCRRSAWARRPDENAFAALLYAFGRRHAIKTARKSRRRQAVENSPARRMQKGRRLPAGQGGGRKTALCQLKEFLRDGSEKPSP